MKDRSIQNVHPRKLARSMAKARIGTNKLSRHNWRRAALAQAEDPIKRGAQK